MINEKLLKIKQDAEDLLRYAISDELFYRAYEAAKRKQRYIYGREYSEIVFQEWYLAKLIEEYVISEEFSQYTIDLCRKVVAD